MRKKVLTILAAILLLASTAFCATVTVNNGCGDQLRIEFTDKDGKVEANIKVQPGQSQKVTIKGGFSAVDIFDIEGNHIWHGEGNIDPDRTDADLNLCK